MNTNEKGPVASAAGPDLYFAQAPVQVPEPMDVEVPVGYDGFGAPIYSWQLWQDVGYLGEEGFTRG